MLLSEERSDLVAAVEKQREQYFLSSDDDVSCPWGKSRSLIQKGTQQHDYLSLAVQMLLRLARYGGVVVDSPADGLHLGGPREFRCGYGAKWAQS